MQENNNISYNIEKPEGVFRDNTFRLRLAIAGIIVFLTIIFDISNTLFMGISTEQIFDAIATDYGTEIQHFIESLNTQ